MLPKCRTVVRHTQSPQKVLEQICNDVSSSEDLIVKKKGEKELILAEKSRGWMYYYSFFPVVTIRSTPTSEGTDLQIDFRLRKSVSIWMLIIYAFAFAMELVTIDMWITGELSSPLLALIPVGIVAFGYLLSLIFFRISVRTVRKILHV